MGSRGKQLTKKLHVDRNLFEQMFVIGLEFRYNSSGFNGSGHGSN